MPEQTENFTHTILLPGGYKARDPKDPETHREVVFGRRSTLGDQVKIESDQQSAVEAQEVLLYARTCVTRFGALRRNPPPLSVLLQLDEVDREALLEGWDEFMRLSLGERVAEEWGADSFKLAFGVEIDGEVYDVVEFTPEPKPLTGYDEVRIERQYGKGTRKSMALTARDAVALAQSDGTARIERPVEVETLERLDAFGGGQLLRWASERRASFRRARRAAA